MTEIYTAYIYPWLLYVQTSKTSNKKPQQPAAQ